MTRLSLLAVLICAGGCSYVSSVFHHEEGQPEKSADLEDLDDYAHNCYDLGLEYLDQSRYELARQQFALAASSAVSKTLYQDALEGLRRADQLIRQQR